MKVLITGICGFLGNCLARELRESDTTLEIVGVDNLSRAGSELNRPELRRLGIPVLHGDSRLAGDL